MQVKNATFLTSAARAEQFLRPQKPMIAVCGKSNAGKSTLINMLAGRKQLAKTSASPAPPDETATTCAMRASSASFPSPVTPETAMTLSAPSPKAFATARVRSLTFMRESLSLLVASTVKGRA